jgi:hypothetical protein
MGQDILIHHNYLEGNSGSYSAIAAVSPAQNIRIENNLAFGWQASTAPNGVFQNAGQYGSLVNNMSFACSSPLLGAVDGSTLRYGNDTGTGTLQAANLTVNGALTGQSTGAFSGLMTANGGISCGSTAASAAGDLSHHLALYGSIYGLSVTGGTLNAVTQGGSFNIYDSAVSATVAAFNTNTITLSYPTQLAANVGFHGASPIARPTVTGAKGSNAALASLLAALSSYGLVTDSTGA